MLVDVEGDRATRVSGDPDHPITAGFLCGKVSNYLDRVYAHDRLLHPLIREGAKGTGAFRRASWDEALTVIADRLREVVASDGAQAVLPYSYLGTMGLLQANSISARFFHALGASRLERTICASAGGVGVRATMGDSPEVDPERWPLARLIVCWGWNPLSTAPHLWRMILAARRAGARLVVIDPFRSRTAVVADEHLAPRPGTDAALALGMMRAIVDAGLADEQWCREHATGYDELLAHLAEYPVERCAELCDVPAEAIARVGRALAEQRPSLIRLGVGAQRHLGAPMAYRTVACLPALAGGRRDEGGGLSYIPRGHWRSVDYAALERPELAPAATRLINMSELGDALGGVALDPPVRALVCWNSNPAVIAPDQRAVLAGLRREDLFTVVLEQFMTDTALHADVVLPATTQLEHRDVLVSWGTQYVTWNEPAIAPLGEARSNTDVFRALAARMGMDHPLLRESDEQVLASVLPDDGPLSPAELARTGWAKVSHGAAAPHRDGGFSTPDGRVALSSAALALAGADALPTYIGPAEPASDDGLALITPKTHLFLNSTFPNQRRQRSAQPEPFVVLNPRDAAARRVADGTLVRVGNDRGWFTARAQVSDDARVGVVVAPMGWWNADYPDGVGPQVATSQRLTRLGASAPSPTFNDARVEVSPVG